MHVIMYIIMCKLPEIIRKKGYLKSLNIEKIDYRWE